jgi:signal transduction histidine kinase/HPt (histidine-containing phosphotransfer) domain-containing protein
MTAHRLLLVEDNQTQQLELRRILETDFSLHVVADGLQALTELDRHDFDLVVSDVLMPGLDGFELCRRIRAAHPALPVILLTGLDGSEHVLKALEAGAQGFVTKPFEHEALLDRINDLLQDSSVASDETREIDVRVGGKKRTLRAGLRQTMELLLSSHHQLRSQQARLELSLAEASRQENTCRGVIDTLDAMILVLDQAGRVQITNERWEVLGPGFTPPDQGLEQSYADILTRGLGPRAEQARPVQEAVERVLGGVSRRQEFEIALGPEADLKWLVAVIQKLPSQDGALLVMADVTTQKELEVLLTAARDAAEAASDNKGNFLANMSHEIRTPLNSIMGLIDLTLRRSLDREQRKYLNLAKQSADALLTLINDILDFSKMEAGKLTIDAQPFSLLRELEAILGPLQVQAGNKGLDLELDVAPGVPDMVVADPVRLRQILVNLVGNALKFTSQGSVLVSVAVKEELPAGEGWMLLVSIRDTGMGIQAEKLENIFDTFYQAADQRGYGVHGTGLGLAISRQLVEMMGGSIGVESVPGRGSTFSFTMPVTPATEHPPESDRDILQAGRPFAGKRALLAEDNRINRQFMTMLLEHLGFTVHAVADGSQALAMLEEADYDIAVMDVQMPVMNGLEATRAIRDARTSAPADLPVVAVTAHAMQGDRERFLEYGLDFYVSKPVDQNQLRLALQEALMPKAPAPENQGVAPDILDAGATLERLQGDEDFLAVLFNTFMQDVPEKLTELEKAIDRQDLATAGQVVGSFVHAAETVGAGTVKRLARHMDAALEAGEPDRLIRVLPDFEQAVVEAMQAMRDYLDR